MKNIFVIIALIINSLCLFAEPTVTPSIVDMGRQCPGTTKNATFTIKNTDTVSITVTLATALQPKYITITPATSTISVGAIVTFNINIVFPNTFGFYNASFTYKRVGDTANYNLWNPTITWDVNPHGDPSNLLVSSVKCNSAHLGWTAAPGATSYDVYRNGGKVKTVTTNSCDFTDLLPSTAYSCYVKANNLCGVSNASNTKQFTTPALPATPTNLAWTTTCYAATITWNAVSGASGYYVKSSSGTVTVPSNSYTKTDLSPSTSYTFEVRSYDANGTSLPATVTVLTKDQPNPPTNVNIIYGYGGGAGILLNWTASTSSGVTGYTVKQVYPVGRTCGTTTSNSFALNSYLEPNMNVFTVQAENLYGSSTSVSAGLYYYEPSNPTNVEIVTFGSTFVMRWTASTTTGILGYTIKQNYPVGRTLGNTTSTSFVLNSYLYPSMNVFTVYTIDKYGLLSTGVTVGCSYTPTSTISESMNMDALKTEFGLDYIYEFSAENNLLGSTETLNNSSITLYPIPANNELFVEGIGEFDAVVYDITGKELLHMENACGSIDISAVKSGTYFIHIKQGESTQIKKFIKQ